MADGNAAARCASTTTGPIAVITNDNPEKRNAFDDAMDQQLWEILAELRGRPDVRAVVWRGEGKAFSSGRDVGAIGGGQVELTHHELMTRGHRGVQQIFDLDAPILVAIQGWAIGASFQRALLCDIRVAAEGARFMLPEVGYGVIPDTGGIGRPVPDLRPRRGERPRAHRPGDGRGGGATRTAWCRASCRPRTSTRRCSRWRRRSRHRRRSPSRWRAA